MVLEIGALAAYTQLTYAVLPKSGPRRLRLFRINMSTLALSHVSPGGTAPGAALGYRLLTQSGVSGADTGFALGTQGIGSAVVLNVIFWLALVAFLVIHGFHVPTSHHGGRPSRHHPGGGGRRHRRGPAGRFRRAVLPADQGTGTGRHCRQEDLRTAALPRSRQDGGHRPATGGAIRRPVGRPPLLIRAVAWATINWLLDAASLWVFVAAFSHFISPIDLLVAYGLANILAAIPITPGGLGVVEFVLVSMITGFGPTPGRPCPACSPTGP